MAFFEEKDLQYLRNAPRNPADKYYSIIWDKLDFFAKRGYHINSPKDFDRMLWDYALARGVGRLIVEDMENTSIDLGEEREFFNSHISRGVNSLVLSIEKTHKTGRVVPANISYDPVRDALILKLNVDIIRS